ncbi:protein-tyrosine phosphatase-like protein [Lactarius quietus]|nr:protein-tyrosine phosphatase-like protein [Lactarius quietus]
MCFSAPVSPPETEREGTNDPAAAQGRKTHRCKQRLTVRSRRVRRVTTSAHAMDAIRIPKVSNVLCSKSGRTLPGTLHLTAHHLIFSYDDDSQSEMWVAYPLINHVNRLPQTLSGQCPISFRCRTFETFSLSFEQDAEATDVFDTVKELTVAESVTQLYAFNYTPSPPLTSSDGWTLYSPREEFGRMGVGTRSKAWRFTDINKDYTFCPTYPSRLVVPTKISDSTLQYGAKYRSKCRIPALTYLHWANYGCITRSSQPMVGLTNARSIQDEKIVESIFSSHRAPESRVSQPVFGATSTNLIIDARPTTNAVANTAKGAGTENMDHYKECKKAYLGIDNIHTMRDSLNKVIEALGESEALAASVSGDLPGTNAAVLPVDRQALRRSGWLRHQVAILEGTLIIVRNVHVNHSHVLIHCSDGWDRTSQLSAVSQLCLDPYYRTTRGFQVLIEKDFISFGHRFLDRCGHLSSEKFFLAPVEGGGGGGADVAQALFASVQNRFVGNHHIKETSPVFHQFLEAVHNIQRQFPARFEFNELLLRDLHTHLYSCQFGTFLFNSERERREGAADTVPVWDYINSQTEKYINPDYDHALDDPTSRAPNADQGVLFPNPKDVRFWHELYGRSDEEMNGRFAAVPAPLPAFVSGVIDSLEDDAALSDTGPVISLSPSGPPSRATSTPPLVLSSSPSPSPAPVISPVPVRVPSPLAPGPRPMRPPPTDLFGSAGGSMRSMWGRLSSGAGAAFSAVQDAYGTTTTTTTPRDTRSRSSSALVTSGGELHDWGPSRFDPPRVAQAVRPSTFAGSSGPAGGGNPWAVPSSPASASSRGPDGMPSVLVDNPWNTTRAALSGQQSPLRDPFVADELAAALPRADRAPAGGSRLPADPSVALPVAAVPVKSAVAPSPHLQNRDPSGAPVLSSSGTVRVSEAPKLPASSSTVAEDMDPLGVGMW